MRLTCPRCDAQYEVPADAIPPAGRDVQCSACGHTWLERPAASVARVAPAALAPGALAVEGRAEEEPDDAPDDAFDEGPPAARPRVSPEVADILREEARREAAARAAEGRAGFAGPGAGPGSEASPETAPGTVRETVREAIPGTVLAATPEPSPAPPAAPPPDEAARAQEARLRMARLRGEGPRPARGPAPSPLSRRDRLPDVEAITSLMRPAPPRPPGPPPREGGRGFRLGFGAALLVVAALALLYATAPRIVAALPASGAVLTPFAAAVDDARLWLDRRLQALARRLGPEPAPEPEPAPATESAAGGQGQDP